MSQSFGTKDLSETFQDFLTGAARLLTALGALASFISIGVLVFLCFNISGDASLAAKAVGNIELMKKVLTVGTLGLAIGSTYLFWGEEFLGAIQLGLAAALFFAPLYLPGLLGGTTNETIGNALGGLQSAGILLGSIAIVVLVVDLANRARNRVLTGSKADQLKYGKGVKEEKDKQNVFLGKCWQLPYCRKFVREKCPIYHSKRTCWKERVGCMCEEEVIRNAMENKPLPKDELLAANYIPRNNRLTDAQKVQRCKTCVIYNEHQKHKYRALLPAILVVYGLLYLGLHGPLVEATATLMNSINRTIHGITLVKGGAETAPTFFIEAMLFMGVLIALTYSLKLLEFAVFKLKI